MQPQRPEVADVFREFGQAFLSTHGISPQQKKVLRDLCRCKTAALGGHKASCDRCGHQEFFYNSCRNRHCPKCQGAATAKWLAKRASDLLNTQYFHVVFTLPDTLGPLALQNKRILYGLLFRAASQTLKEIASDQKHLGAQIGFTAVLHTWGQRLDHHPHIHCLVPGGGLCEDRTRWISARKNFFLPVRVLSRLFRAKFLRFLQEAFEKGELEFHGKLASLCKPRRWRPFLKAMRGTDWVVYCKPPFGGPEQVLKYLARYTHRVAISNQRLLCLQDAKLTLRYKDYRAGTHSVMTLMATEFIRRFLQHVLPSGFQRIRHYGFLSNRFRKDRIALCRTFLGTFNPTSADLATDQPADPGDPLCPACKEGHLVLQGELQPDPTYLTTFFPWFHDTS